MKRPKQTDKECRRQGMTDVPVANYSKMQDKYIDYLEKKLKNNSVLDDVSKCCGNCDEAIINEPYCESCYDLANSRDNT